MKKVATFGYVMLRSASEGDYFVICVFEIEGLAGGNVSRRV